MESFEPLEEITRHGSDTPIAVLFQEGDPALLGVFAALHHAWLKVVFHGHDVDLAVHSRHVGGLVNRQDLTKTIESLL